MNSRTLVIALFAFAALANLNGLAMYPFLPSIAEEFDTSVSLIGQALTIALIGGAIIGLIVGPLSDRFGYRRFLLLGAVLMAASCAGTALVSSYEMLILVRFPGGLATGILGGIGVSIATTRLDEKHRRSAIGWVASGAALGAVVGPPVMTTLAELGSWRTGFWFLGCAPLLLATICFRVIGADKASPDVQFRPSETISAFRAVLADRRSLLLQSAMLFWAIPVMGGSAYLGAYLVQEHGFSLSGTGLAYMWAAFWLMIGPRVGVKLLDSVELYSLIVAAGAIMALTITLVFWMPLGTPWILILIACWTLSMGLGTPLITSAISEAAPGGQGTVMMMRQFSFAIGGALGVAFGGGLIASGGYALFALVAGLSAIVVAALALTVARIALQDTSASIASSHGG